jgi:HAD superfamily hydrolase (TIGR01509 family)
MENMSSPQGSQRHSLFLSDQNRKIQAVLFDMDGVLVDSIPLHRKAWNSALAEKKLPLLDPDRYSSMLGRTSRDILSGHLDVHQLRMSAPIEKEMIAKKERYLRGLLKKSAQVTPGVMSWLSFFKRKQIRCAVASSAEMGNIVAVLDLLELADYFVSIISGSWLPASKPDPAIFLLAAASLGVMPENCLVIEDAPDGVRAARAANMLSCAIATTLPLHELKQADLVLENLMQVDPEALFTDDQFEFLR